MSRDCNTTELPSAAGLAIIAALPGEARCLARLRPRGRRRLACGAVLALSGIGAQRARMLAETLAEEGAQALLSFGTAGALAPWLDPGAIVLPSILRDGQGRSWPVCAPWRDVLAHQLAPRRRVDDGCLLERSEIVSDPDAKRRLHAETGAVACDMESAAIAAVAAERGLSFIALRAIVDDATMTLPPVALAAIDADGRLRPAAVMAALAGRPTSMHTQLRALKQLAVAFRAARISLAEAARVVAR